MLLYTLCAATKYLFCISADKLQCEKDSIPKTLGFSATDYTFQINAPTDTIALPASPAVVDPGSQVLFIGNMDLSIENFKIFVVTNKRLTMLTYGGKVKVALGKDFPITSGDLDLPACITFTGSILLQYDTEKTLDQIKQYGIPVKVDNGKTLTLIIFDTVDSAPPADLISQTGTGAIKYKLVSCSLDTTFLTINGNTVEWGKSIITPSANKNTFTTEKAVFVTTKGTAPAAENLPIFKGEKMFYFDKTFPSTGIFVKTDDIQYVIDAAATTYLPPVSSTPVTHIKIIPHCLVKSGTTGCPSMKDHFDPTDTKAPEVSPSFTDGDVFFLDKEVTFTTNHAYLSKTIILDDADKITIKITGVSNSFAGYDFRKPIWTFADSSTASNLLDASITMTVGEINPACIPKDSTKFGVTLDSYAITPENSGNTYDASTVTLSSSNTVKIIPYVQNPSAQINNNNIVMNGATIKTAKSASLEKIEISPLPGQGVSLSQNKANPELEIAIVGANGNLPLVKFDSSWNSVTDKFVDITGSVETSFNGVPPWLSTDSLSSSSITPIPPPSNPAPSKGLEGWAIALIVIACVIVVAAIVVGVLFATGVMHFGKKKVEV